MAALVQAFPQQSSPIAMLQTRPSSASGTLQSSSQGQSHAPRSPPMQRSIYNSPSGLPATGYRGQASTSPVATYAFTTTPSLAVGGNNTRQNQTIPQIRSDNRTFSAPASTYSQQTTNENSQTSPRQRYSVPQPPTPRASSSPSSPSLSGHQLSSKDDSSDAVDLRSVGRTRPMSTIESSVPVIPAPAAGSSSKPSPDRYRRNRKQENGAPVGNSQQTIIPNGSALPSGSGMAAVGHLYNHPAQSNSSPSLHTYQSFGGLTQVHSPWNAGVNGVSPGLVEQGFTGRPALVPGSSGQARPSSVDDMHIKKQSSQELAKRYRRRSLGTLSLAELEGLGQEEIAQAMLQLQQGVTTAQLVLPTPSHQSPKDTKSSPGNTRPGSSHGRNNSAESTASSLSSHSSVKRTSPGSSLATNPISVSAHPKNEVKAVNIPPRGSSETGKRLNNPSPLSRPLTLSPDTPTSDKPMDAVVPNSAAKLVPTADSNAAPPPSPSSITGQESRATQQLAALNGSDPKKGMKSRLRRAFSFGSAAELRRASAENNMNKELANERVKMKKEKYREAREAEQAAIARKQEAGGIGEGIYSGQGNFFTGSTDNISISSTASSASVMIRKMGQGMKKSTRSLVGLFRPKSVIGKPAMESSAPEPSVAQVSMITVEAERERVNVNPCPHDQVRGGTGFPKLERNSIDAANAGTLDDECASTGPVDSGESIPSRKSIIGGEKERAEVLLAVKKGILKRSGTDSGSSSPVTKPVDSKSMEFTLPSIPHVNETPSSSHSSTPADERPLPGEHKRTDSVTIEGEEYFMSPPRFSGAVLDSKSAPGTPQGTIRHNVNFSPRIQFHDTWPSGEYDRRGEIATCNRLTPLLAQQIKEELNTFKMEMEVHEQSKVYTHFF